MMDMPNKLLEDVVVSIETKKMKKKMWIEESTDYKGKKKYKIIRDIMIKDRTSLPQD